jgi:hypothetical protein
MPAIAAVFGFLALIKGIFIPSYCHVFFAK